MNKKEVIENRYSMIHKTRAGRRTSFCFAYMSDLEQAYAFYCARYENITWHQFMNLGFFELKKKLSSVPKSEPLYEIIQSRVIEISKLKNKDDKKHWYELKRINEIPAIFLPYNELDSKLNEHAGRKL